MCFLLEVLGASGKRQLMSACCLFPCFDAVFILTVSMNLLMILIYNFKCVLFLKCRVCEKGGIGKRWTIWVFSLFFVMDVVLFLVILGGGLVYLDSNHRKRRDFIQYIG